MNPLAALAGLLSIAAVHAAYPSALAWTDCGTNTKCGHLEFCQNADKYGYRAIGDTSTPCGSVPGPLIRMEKGTIYKLVLHNTASVNTNIHTHGLHIVGDGDGDDVTRVVEGNNMCLDYTWAIAVDHPGGTYWYHPHYHGETNKQVAGGAFGMLIIEDDEDEVNEWAHIANERLLLVSSLGSKDNDYNGGGGGWDNDRSLQNWNGGGDNDMSVLANGLDEERYQVLPDHWFRFRTSVVTPSAEPDYLTFSNGCTVYKVASDGVWHAAGLTSYKGSSFQLTGASRADFAIRCSAGSSAISWGGSKVATIDASTEYDSAGGVPSSGNDAADLGDAPPRAASVEDLTSASVPISNQFSIAPKKDAIQFEGVAYPAMSGLGDIQFGEIYEMKIKESKRHPFHLHLYHMQIMTPGGCGDHVEGEYYDTILGTKDQPCTVRFQTVDVGQKMVIHCHENDNLELEMVSLNQQNYNCYIRCAATYLSPQLCCQGLVQAGLVRF